MATDKGLDLSFSPNRRSGKGYLRATLNGQDIYTAKLDLTDPDQRSKFIKTLCDQCPGIDPGEAAQALEESAGQYVRDGDEEHNHRKATQSQTIVRLADGAELFHDGDMPYATVVVHDNDRDNGTEDTDARQHVHRETHAISGKSFRMWLARGLWHTHGKAPGSQAMQEALDVLSARAMHDGPQRPVAVRIAQHDGAVHLDLCNARWEAVKVTPGGWERVTDPPVKFVRRRGMLPLPAPVRGGSINELRPLINAGDDASWLLIVAWLVGACRPQGPFPILAVNGEQGSAKTTLCKMLRRLIDPNEADLRAAPRDDRDLMIAAGNSWVMAFDNLSHIPPALSDALCRLATGGGFATRELYSNDDEKLFNASRPIIINGIEELATRPDLLERAIVLNLPSISDENRKTESLLWQQYEPARPRILGALLDAISAALRNLASVKLSRPPRMADFAEWVVAAEPALPCKPGVFMDAYCGNRDAVNELAIEASATGPAILSLMHGSRVWEGTAKELLAALEQDPHTDTKTRNRIDWPKTPRAMAGSLRRIAPTLRRLGVEYSFVRKAGGKRARIIHLERGVERPSRSSHIVPPRILTLKTPFVVTEPGRSGKKRDDLM